jgi:two-component system KDP operon response regulator KdpE
MSTELYRVHEASTAVEGLAQAATRQPDVVLLDLGLPDTDGLEVIKRIRGWNPILPIIVLSARQHESDKITALDLGADDYISKPFSSAEVLARLRVVLRRSAIFSQGGSATPFCFGQIEVDFNRRRVLRAGVEIHLTRIEFRLLQVLAQYADKVLTQGFLLNEVWGPNRTDQAHYLRIYMAQLRRKLETDPAQPQHLRTQPGVGYSLVTQPDPA